MSYADLIMATPGLKAYWRLGDAGPTAVDSKSGHDGTGTNVTWAQAGALTGDTDKAVEYTLGTSKIVVPYHVDLHPGDTLSIECWYKRTATGAFHQILSGGGNDYSFRFHNTNKIAFDKRATANIFVSTAAYTDSNWHHLVVTKSPTECHVYRDGAEIAGTVTMAALVPAVGQQTYIGMDNSGTGAFAGYLDEVALYNRALSAGEALQHYQAGVATSNYVIQTPPLRVHVFWEDLEFRRAVFAKTLSCDAPSWSINGGGTFGLTVPCWDEDGERASLSRREDWYRTLAVLHHPLLPALPLAPVSVDLKLGLELQVKFSDALFWTRKRMVQVPNGLIGHDDLRQLILEALNGARPTPIREVAWRAEAQVYDMRGTWRVEGNYVSDVLNLLAKEMNTASWVEWDEERQCCRLVVANLEWTEPDVHLTLQDFVQRPEIHEDLAAVGNYGLCGIYYGRLAGREFFFAEDEQSEKRYGYRDLIIAPHTQGYEEIVRQVAKAPIELPFAVRVESLAGVHLGDTVALDLPGENYRLIVQGIGLSPDGGSAILSPYALEEA